MEPRQMHAFARREKPSLNETRLRNAANDDLKVSLPKMNLHAVHRSSARREPQDELDSHDGHLFDTQASIDESPVMASEEHANTNTGPVQQPTVHPIKNDPDMEDWVPSSGSADEDEEENDMPGGEQAYDEHLHDSLNAERMPRIDGKLNALQQALMPQLDQLVHGRGFTAKLVQGDSYPATTDGDVSISDASDTFSYQAVKRGEYQQQQHQAWHHSVRVPTQPHRMNQSAMVRVPLAAETEQHQAQEHPNPVTMSYKEAESKHRDVAQIPSAIQTLGEQFQFLRPASHKDTKQSRVVTSAQVPSPSASVQTVSNKPAHAGSKNREPGGRIQETRPAYGITASKLTVEQQSRESKSHRKTNRTSAPMPQQSTKPAQEFEQLSDDDINVDEATRDERDYKEQHVEGDVSDLDYSPPALYRMDYEDLKSRPFDEDPRAPQSTTLGRLPAGALSDRLAAVAAHQPDDQAKFFETLDIHQWEEAGDWFLGRFGELVSKLKAARQEKRKAARAFEEEVDKRHYAIGEKRKLTDNALSEMKASGSQVLQATPKRSRTK